jgi:hypothetical protein
VPPSAETSRERRGLQSRAVGSTMRSDGRLGVSSQSLPRDSGSAGGLLAEGGLMALPCSRAKFRLRFSLRTLLLVVTVASVWLGYQADRVTKQRHAVAAILAAGGRVTYTHKTVLGGRSYSTLPAHLRLLDDDWFFSVEGVTLYGPGCNDEVLAHVADLPSITKLALWAWAVAPIDGPVAKDGQGYLQWLPRDGVTDDGIAVLASLPNLEHVSFLGNRITDKGLEHLRKCPRLTSVQIDFGPDCGISRQAYKSLLADCSQRGGVRFHSLLLGLLIVVIAYVFSYIVLFRRLLAQRSLRHLDWIYFPLAMAERRIGHCGNALPCDGVRPTEQK